MSKYYKACRDCAQNGDCLFQSNDDVESCQDVENWEDQIDLCDPPECPDRFSDTLTEEAAK